MFEKFINDEVWKCNLKYIRMMRITKEKFFESLLKGKSSSRYAKELKELWTMDHNFMDKAIKELETMVKDKDIALAKKYGDEKIVQRSIKLENQWQEYNNIDYQIYKLNPERDFTIMEQRYVNRHISYYENTQKGLELATDKEAYLNTIVPKYDKIDKSIPYFSHATGEIRCY
jgi:oligoribonuclease NrnB/cAMP/cGMP phosphodiesterase (DHH superfamily)